MFNAVRQVWTWFIDGLVEALTTIVDSFGGSSRVRLTRDGDGYRVDGGGNSGAQVQFVTDGAETRIEPESVARSLAGQPVDVALQPEQMLVRSLDPLPAESREYLEEIVRHQLDRLLPWRADEVAYAYRLTTDAGGKLLVTVAATSRVLHVRLLSALRALSPGELRLVCSDPQFENGEIGIPVDGKSDASRAATLRRAVVTGLAAMAALLVGGSALIAWQWQNADDALEAVEQALVVQRRNVMASGQGIRGDRELDAMMARRRDTPYAVLALDQLSVSLPDDTWLTEIRLSEGKLRITGVSRNVPALVPMIEAAPGFAEATFFAPTTRLQNGRGDRFHLETRLSNPERKP